MLRVAAAIIVVRGRIWLWRGRRALKLSPS
jgi:hypothetical protein